jgi:hypothetical protein
MSSPLEHVFIIGKGTGKVTLVHILVIHPKYLMNLYLASNDMQPP